MKIEVVKANKRKSERKRLEKELMNLWQEIVKLRAGNKCEWWGCHKRDYLNAHHVFSKSGMSVRFDIENGMCLCSGHHSLNTESAHKNPEFLKMVLGEIDGYRPLRTKTWYQALRLRAYTPQKLDLKMELLYLQKELQNLRKSSQTV